MRSYRCAAMIIGALTTCLLTLGVPQAHAAEHVVRPGETLTGIATRYGTSIADLVRANGIADPHLVLVGTRLQLPGTAARQARPAVSVAGGTSAPAAGPVAVLSPRDEARLQIKAHADLIPVFRAAAREFGVRADLLMALTFTESRWHSEVVSSAGAAGIGQQLPETVEWLRWRLGEPQLDARRPHDSIRMAAALLRVLVDETGSTRLGLAAYYQGFADVQRRGVTAVGARYAAKVLDRSAWFTGV